MTALDVAIITASLINLVFSAIVYFHSRRKLVETVFALFALSVSLWALSTFLMTSNALSFEIFKVGAVLHYLSGNLIFFSLLWFSIFFPSRRDHSLLLPLTLSIADAVILILIVSSTFLFVSFENAIQLSETIAFNSTGYVILSAVTIAMFALSQIFLSRKYLISMGEEKTQIGGIILATSIAGSLGLLTNLILPGFGNFSVFYLGPIVTTPLFVGIMVYAIVKYKLFNLRVIAAEIFTALLMVSLAAELFLANTSVEVTARAGVFVIAALLGFFLIKSVYREIRAREEIERLNRTMSEFLAIASHQIRTPLTHIKTALSLIKEGSYGQVDPRALGLLSTVFLSTGRLITLVNDLLDVSRMESEKLQYVLAEFDFTRLVDSVAAEFKLAAAEKGLSIIWHSGNISVQMNGDEAKLRQVVFNLVDNALKYTQKGFIEITVRLERDLIHLTIKDSGAGMSKETISRLFQKFARGKSASPLKAGGTGLGLYVAKRIIDDHHGELWAESEGEGRESAFHLKLLAKGHEQPAQKSTNPDNTTLAKAA